MTSHAKAGNFSPASRLSLGSTVDPTRSTDRRKSLLNLAKSDGGFREASRREDANLLRQAFSGKTQSEMASARLDNRHTHGNAHRPSGAPSLVQNLQDFSMTTHGIPTGARVIAPDNINSKERADPTQRIVRREIPLGAGVTSAYLPRPSGRGLFAQPLNPGVCAKRTARVTRGRFVSPPYSSAFGLKNKVAMNRGRASKSFP